MKKTVFVAAALFAASVGFAQNLTSNKGEAYLPETGDKALGFDAVPVLNILKFNNNSTVSANYVDGMSIFGKQFHDANSASRYGVAFSFGTSNSLVEVADLSSSAAPDQMVTDEMKNNNFNVMLSLGHEHRRGTGRVQGYAGLEGILSLGTSSSKNEYGNSLLDANDADPTVTSRILEQNGSFSFGIGGRAFMGVEFFFAPKLSIGAEYGLGLMYNSVAAGDRTEERITTSNGSTTVEEVTIDPEDRNRSFGLATDVNNGSVRLTFHF